ncbi:transposase [Oceanobacillus locisalsi]|uniref:Transposase n=1 Tax=Oceanobacillus locisalsi TaxID=546107 RepID=A0ABW3NGU7_9BACI
MGITSIMRDLGLPGHRYETLVHFFRSSAWSLESLRKKWLQIVKRFAPLFYLNGRVVLVGDGMKQAKEARHMPGVKKLHQESENTSKAAYIFGHLFGAIGVLMGTPKKWFCLPLFINLQDGVKAIFDWSHSSKQWESHVIQVIDQGFNAAKGLKENGLLLLDRYFLTAPALKRWTQLNQSGGAQLHLVTRAKMNAVAYELPPKKKKGRGRPRKKGNMIKLNTLFQSRADEFQTATVTMYEKQETVQYLCLDLLWGQGHYQKLRFVLVKYNGGISILVSTDLTLEPVDIIQLYGHRFKIECTFREMKQAIGGFSYQFWSKSVPKLKKYLQKGETHPLEQVTDPKDRRNIRQTVKAIEGFVMCSCIAMGLLQLIAVKFSHKSSVRYFRYLRTPSKSIVSEATVMAYLRRFIFLMFARNPRLTITQIIQNKRKNPEKMPDSNDDRMVS